MLQLGLSPKLWQILCGGICTARAAHYSALLVVLLLKLVQYCGLTIGPIVKQSNMNHQDTSTLLCDIIVLSSLLLPWLVIL